MSNNPLVRLGELGQSPWYDYITRELITSGQLARLIADDGLLGMTSNPTIFHKAVSGSDLYDDEIRELAEQGCSPKDTFEALAVADVQAACDLFGPVWERTGGRDGLVSLEVDPALAYDTTGTESEVERLWTRVDRPNVMIKIPGTRAGLPAITRSLARGISVNVTLLFSVSRYLEVIEAFLAGLEARAAAGGAIDRIRSVASFFVSRVDTKVDAIIDGEGLDRSLRGTAAIANACVAYARFRDSLATPRWRALAARGGTAQRPLWASTSTKDPAYSDTYYVEALIAPDTVNTLPPATFAAYRDHGRPEIRIAAGVAAAPGRLRSLAQAGVDLEAITRVLEDEGVESFAASYRALLEAIAAKQAGTGGRRAGGKVQSAP